LSCDLLVYKLKKLLKSNIFDIMIMIEHSVIDHLLRVPKMCLRGASSTGKNGGTSVYVLKEPTLNGVNLLFL
jgi:hypothetical protein